MARKTYYLLGTALFVPVILWYASNFTDLPEVTFQGAETMSTSEGKVLVSGTILHDKGIEVEGGEVSFYLKDEDGSVERIDYDGSGSLEKEDVESAIGAEVAGHMCGERFHAKNVYLND